MFFLFAGFVSRAVDTLMIAKIDQYDEHFKGYYYRYLAVSPNYLTIPFTFLFVKSISRFSTVKKMGACAIGVSICMLFTLKIVFLFPIEKYKFLAYMLLFVFYLCGFIL